MNEAILAFLNAVTISQQLAALKKLQALGLGNVPVEYLHPLGHSWSGHE